MSLLPRDSTDPILEKALDGERISADEALEMLPVLVGSVDELCEILVQRREAYGFSYIVVHDGEMEDFAPVVARLAGT